MTKIHITASLFRDSFMNSREGDRIIEWLKFHEIDPDTVVEFWTTKRRLIWRARTEKGFDIGSIPLRKPFPKKAFQFLRLQRSMNNYVDRLFRRMRY